MKIVITKHGIKDDSELIADSSGSDESVYEVIRIIDGFALFIEDHFARLKNSLKIKGVEFEMQYEDFQHYIAELVKLNQKNQGNIKFVYNMDGATSDWYFSFIPHSYPDQKDYKNGVSVELLFGERANPNAKVMQQNLWDKANQMISDLNVYEVLLVDRDGLITEGSRSNVFFVKNNVFYTAPASLVLIGITRQKVNDCLAELGFPLVEFAVSAAGVGSYDAAFLTGTSPKVLPIRTIGKYGFDPDVQVVNRLIEEYDHRIEQYIQKEKFSGKY